MYYVYVKMLSRDDLITATNSQFFLEKKTIGSSLQLHEGKGWRPLSVPR